jgi:hypothetical protein
MGGDNIPASYVADWFGAATLSPVADRGFDETDELTVWQRRHKRGVADMITKHTALILLELFAWKLGSE